MSRGPLEVLRDTLGFVEASLGSSDEMPTSLREAIAQVESLALTVRRFKGVKQANGVLVPTDQFVELVVAAAPFTPGQDSEGGGNG